MKRSMSQRAYSGWQRYWEEEPWGPYRDNLHAATIAREVKLLFAKRGTRVPLDDFMYQNPRHRQQDATTSLIGVLRTIATPHPKDKPRPKSKKAKARKKA